MKQRDFQQIAELVKARFGSGKVDGRRLSSDVKRWAKGHGLLVTINGKLQFPEHTQDGFIARFETPAQSILILMEQEGVFENVSIGISIAKRKFWNYLDIYSKGQGGFGERDLIEQEQVLVRLHQEGLIYFQSAGSLWDVRRV